MKNIEVKVVNAFTADSQGGNPAGVVLEAENLSDDQMLAVAREVGASETAFILPSDSADYHLRFFTPTMEVPLCGHATIASWWLMYSHGLTKTGSFIQESLAGRLAVEVSADKKIFLEQPEQPMRQILARTDVAEALRVPESSLDETFETRIVNRQVMVGLREVDTLDTLDPDFPLVEQVSKQNDIFGFHVFVLSRQPDLLANVRNFCPAAGIDEDAATGTGNGSFLAYLDHYKLLPLQEIYAIEQGKAMGRRSLIFGMFKGDQIWVGGGAAESKTLSVTA